MPKAAQQPRFVQAHEEPLPNYVWIIDTQTGRAQRVGLCNLHGFRQALDWIAAAPTTK